MHLLVDPIVIALPQSPVTEEQVLSFFEHLMRWSGEIRANRHEFIASEPCIEALYLSNRYPTPRGIQQLLERFPIEDVDAKTVYAACSRIIENYPYFEQKATVREDEIIVDTDSVYSSPDVSSRLEEPLTTAFRETLGYIAFASEQVKPPLIDDLMLVTHPPIDGACIHIKALLVTDTGEVELETEFPLIWEPETLRQPIDSWEHLLEEAQNAFPHLIFLDSFLNGVKNEPFVPSIANRAYDLLAVLNEFKTCFDGSQFTDRGHELKQNWFNRKDPPFVDESDTNKITFKSALTFKLPDGTPILCSHHGRIRHRTYRLHFSHPIRHDEPVYIAYLGPKLTRD
jgi:hypothetical protein